MPRTHDLRGLAELAIEINSDLENQLENVGDLTKYITASRYPTELNFTEDLATKAIDIAEQVYETLYGVITTKR